MYGWDSRSATWHGPNELGDCSLPHRRLLHGLRATLGNSWYGQVNCCTAGEAPTRLFVLVHDLSDCAIALIYCDESKMGPVEILAVIPPGKCSQVREEFAFEFLTFARFLGSLGAGSELPVHDGIAAALAEETGSSAIVFSISSGLWPRDLDPVLSSCVEQVALSVGQWLDESASSHHRPRGSVSAA